VGVLCFQQSPAALPHRPISEDSRLNSTARYRNLGASDLPTYLQTIASGGQSVVERWGFV
jgi:hypothetical protein